MVASLIFVFSVIAIATAVPAYNKTQIGASCTVTSYDTVSTVVNSCTTITVNGFTVPAGKTLEFALKSGTSITFKGTIKWDYEEWVGPLLKITGSGIKVTGASGHTFDGQGAKYWDTLGDKGITKPKFFKIKATGGSIFKNIHLLNCPRQCVSISNSKQLTITGWNVDVSAGDADSLGHDTDGFDISQTETLTMTNVVVKNQDDCIAINSGNDLYFRKLTCSGGHGISFSVGQSATDSSKNYAQNITISDSTVTDSDNGIHIKTHVDAASGYINDVTYSNIKLSGIRKYGINVQEDYKNGGSSGTPGNNIPITGLTLSSITGSMTGTKGMAVYIICGSSGCSNFQWSGVSITGAQKSNKCNFSPSGFSC